MTERQDIPIRFADLRQLTSSVPVYIAERTCEQLLSFQTRIEDDLGCTGDDMVELLEEFSETYLVDVANFNFTGLISPEGLDSMGCLLALPLAAYFLVGRLLKTVAGLLCGPFDGHLARRIWQQQVPIFWHTAERQPKPLVIGDFIASAAVGQFVRRHQVYFRLVR